MDTVKAQEIADEEGLDLVKIAANSNPAVCKIMDYGKYRFEQTKKEKENRRNQIIVITKEVQLSINIQEHDLMVKVKRAEEFIGHGDKVKIVVKLRGGMNRHPELGVKSIEMFVEKLSANYVVEKPIDKSGKIITMIIAPTNKKC